MTPAARLSAAIEVLDRVLAGAASDRALLDWGRGHRFAGSGDRAAIADLVHDALRRRRALAHAGGADSGRGLIVGLTGGDAALFAGLPHGPEPLTAAEVAALAAAPPPDTAVLCNYPDWLDAELRRSLGSALVPVMQALGERAPLDLRVNLLKSDRTAAIAALAGEGVQTDPLGDPAALRVREGARGLRQTRAYRQGRVEIQDLASQRVARAAGASPGLRVLDYCAGGGGKTLALAMHMQNRGQLLAHDAAVARLADLRPRAQRAGVTVQILPPDHPSQPPLGCDLVLVDAPCSGSGAWRRNPDSKWRLDPAGLERLIRLQDAVLRAASRHVRPGGRLVYATCSLLTCENSDRIAAFLADSPGWSPGQEQRFLPPEDGDGFYLYEICYLKHA